MTQATIEGYYKYLKTSFNEIIDWERDKEISKAMKIELLKELRKATAYFADYMNDCYSDAVLTENVEKYMRIKNLTKRIGKHIEQAEKVIEEGKNKWN